MVLDYQAVLFCYNIIYAWKNKQKHADVQYMFSY